MKGFFSSEEVLKESPFKNRRPRCGECGLYRKCRSPKMPVSGEGRRKVLVVAEAPGSIEDDEGVQLVGKAGQRFRDELDKIGVDLDEDCWKTNAVICRPPSNEIVDTYIECCRPNLDRTIEELKPETIVLLGGSAVKSLITEDWSRDLGPVGRWVGWRIPSQRLNAWVCPTWHSSYIMREEKKNKVVSVIFLRHLKEAFDLVGSPWEEVPDWKKEVEIYECPETASEIIQLEGNRSKQIAFDYETDRLKPDGKDARIVSCSICFDGRRTIAYPWESPAREATGSLLRSEVRKIGSNIKFEERWTKAEFGYGVRSWDHDCMQAAHVLDNRQGITSAKFQAYVRLGFPSWDERIGPY